MNTFSLFLFIGASNTLTYLFIYPQLVKSNIKRLVIGDLSLAMVLLTVIGVHYAGTETRFNLLIFETNWLVATLIFDLMAGAVLLPIYQRRFPIDLNSL